MSHDSYVILSEGSYRCKCIDGYKGTGYQDECEDANECIPGLNECPQVCFNLLI